MNTSAVASLVRGWVDFYTRGLPDDVRATRRDEVADDLWCQHEEAALADRSSSSLSVEMFLRLLLGVPSDLSWRWSRLGGAGASAPERRSSMATRVIGALAIIGGGSWLIAAFVALIRQSADGGIPILTVGGVFGLAGALVGLTFRYQDHLSPLAWLMGELAAIAVVMGTMGAYTLMPLLPIGSAILIRELGRADILPGRHEIVHPITALGMSVLLVIMLLDWQVLATQQWLMALAIPYLLSWIAIGASVLRGVPDQAADIDWEPSPAAGAGASVAQSVPVISARAIGVMAIIGGVTWLIDILLILALGQEVMAGLWLVALAGAFAFGGALIALAARFVDRIGSVATGAGGLAAAGVVLGTMGAYPLTWLFPVGSAIYAFELGRAGMLPRFLSISHALTAVGMLAVIVAAMTDWHLITATPVLLATIPYLLTWIAIGLSVLVRGLPDVSTASEESR
ncbi:MAG TPA: hypothetical protein VF114_07910 [Candidatus Limnocylindria bacterium]